MRLAREHRTRAWLAWHTAAMGRMKNMPTLDDLTGEPRARSQPEPQSWQEIRDIARAYTSMLGGTVTQRTQVE